MSDIVVRAPWTDALKARLKQASSRSTELEPITDQFYAPTGANLRDFDPGSEIVRERDYPDRTEFARIEIEPREQGYVTHKTPLDSLDGYEEWGSFTCQSTRHIVSTPIGDAIVLHERFSFGEFAKIEAENEATFRAACERLRIRPADLVAKSSVVLLAEHLGLIEREDI